MIRRIMHLKYTLAFHCSMFTLACMPNRTTTHQKTKTTTSSWEGETAPPAHKSLGPPFTTLPTAPTPTLGSR